MYKEKLLCWAQQFEVVAWLDSNNYQQNHSQFEAILAVGCETKISCNYNSAFEKLSAFKNKTNDYLFGYFGYDLKNDIEQLHSNNYDGLEFRDLYFFQPQKIFFLQNNKITATYLNAYETEINADLSAIENQNSCQKKYINSFKIEARIKKNSYLKKVNKVLQHISRGDIYEANFCQEFYSNNAVIDPVSTYINLNKISKPPFATFLKVNDKFLLSASPERYLQKKGTNVISQPIKGTAKRASNFEEDKALISELENNLKERAENIMIVDLVRNDLSHFAKKGTVTVNELCKVYTFKQVHQLISTVSCKVDANIDVVKLIKNTFPMGSMTGAPKISAMQIIEKLEETKRGLYSGAVGYFTPENNFDFNVVIRSILYNQSRKYVSFSVGSAITSKSIPVKEYEECLLKAKAMQQVLLTS